MEEAGIHYDVLVVEVNPELPQTKKHDIRYTEPLALYFDHADQMPTRVKALRKDFPSDVPHLNLVPAGAPRELCVYDQPLEVVQLTWTPPEFLRRIAFWLARTATGTLHAPDQPLEPFLLGSTNEVIIPHDLYTVPKPENRHLIASLIVRDAQRARYSLRVRWQPSESTLSASPIFFVVSVSLRPRQHGLIHNRPRNLQELTDVIAEEDFDLTGWLRNELRQIYLRKPSPRDQDYLLLLLEVPQQRESDAPIERRERWAFAIGNSIGEVSVAVGACERSPDRRYVLLIDSPTAPTSTRQDLSAVTVEPLRVVYELTRAAANWVSGITASNSERLCVLVGAGALGGQVYLTLARMGWGSWTLVDDDVFLPHNIVRHVLGDESVGLYKVRALEQTAKFLVPYNQPAAAFVANAMECVRDESLAGIFQDATVIVDTSASIAVARALALNVKTQARLASAFLTPSGRDSVVMIEDRNRAFRLDILEQQYYRAILRDDRLQNHLHIPKDVLRYSGSCRDVTTIMGQDDILIHAGIVARHIRLGVEQNEAQLSISCLSDNGNIERLRITLSSPRATEMNGWKVSYDDGLIDRCFELRSRKLPKETGGILVGYFDVPRKTVYLVDALPAPPDSVEHTTAFIRGTKGLRESLNRIRERTAKVVDYVGEWHSHPIGVSVQPSYLDTDLLRQITEEMRSDGWPGVILISGDGGTCAIYVQTGEDLWRA